jgi:hypothetical protein
LYLLERLVAVSYAMLSTTAEEFHHDCPALRAVKSVTPSDSAGSLRAKRCRPSHRLQSRPRARHRRRGAGGRASARVARKKASERGRLG